MVLPDWWPSKNNYVIGETLEVLKTLPEGVVQCVVTSPPYWGLRDYGTAKWEGGDPNCDHINPKKRSTTYKTTDDKRQEIADQQFGVQFRGKCEKCGAKRIDEQIGLEETPEEYVENLVKVFREIRRVLRDDGTLWLNLGDSYNGSGGPGSQYDNKASAGQKGAFLKYDNPNRNYKGLKPKDLVGIPWMVAFALRADGWYLRSDIIWNKPNPMPESVTDRPTKSHEYIFLLTKSARYYYDNEAVKETVVREWDASNGGNLSPDGEHKANGKYRKRGGDYPICTGKRNARSVWTITTKPFKGAHFATFPDELPETCIKAGTSLKGCCAKCGKPLERVIERVKADRTERTDNPNIGGLVRCPPELDVVKTTGWEATCQCKTDTVPCIVLDPFLGSGTTVSVARKIGRLGLGIELNPKYEELIRQRTRASLTSLLDFGDVSEVCMRAGTSPNACPKCGAPWERVVEIPKRPEEVLTDTKKPQDGFVSVGAEGKGMGQKLQDWRNEHPPETVGWRPTCDCDDEMAQTIKKCVLAGTSTEGACPKCGSPMERIVETKGIEAPRGTEPSKVARGLGGQADRSIPGGYRPETKTVGWKKTCDCKEEET
jgi:DNA modification methylase